MEYGRWISDGRTVPAPHVGMSSAAAAPFTVPSLIWGLLLCVLLAAIVLVRSWIARFTAHFAPAICSPTCTRRPMAVSVTAR